MVIHVGNVIKYLSMLTLIGGVIIGLNEESPIFFFTGVFSAVFMFGFGEIICLLGDINQKLMSLLSQSQTDQVVEDNQIEYNTNLTSNALPINDELQVADELQINAELQKHIHLLESQEFAVEKQIKILMKMNFERSEIAQAYNVSVNDLKKYS